MESAVRATIMAPTLSLKFNINQYSDLRKAQEQDPDIQSDTKPDWQTVASRSPFTKLYWAQWKSLWLREGVLHWLWETPAGDHAYVVW